MFIYYIDYCYKYFSTNYVEFRWSDSVVCVCVSLTLLCSIICFCLKIASHFSQIISIPIQCVPIYCAPYAVSLCVCGANGNEENCKWYRSKYLIKYLCLLYNLINENNLYNVKKFYAFLIHFTISRNFHVFSECSAVFVFRLADWIYMPNVNNSNRN